jgi:hypothetical protein
MLSSLLNPAVQSLHSTLAAAREYANLRPPFPVLKSRQRETRQRELKVCGKATLKVNRSNSVNLDFKYALANNAEESDDDFPSLKELSRAVRPKILTEASKTGAAL